MMMERLLDIASLLASGSLSARPRWRGQENARELRIWLSEI
jgi:hypothetical protein